MSTNIDTVIAELIEQRRAKQSEVQRIDEALLALQPFVTSKARRRTNLTPEQRAAAADRMRQTWASRKAAGLPMGRQANVELTPELVGVS